MRAAWAIFPAALLACGPAIADWQYTRWGMSEADLDRSDRFAIPTNSAEVSAHSYAGFGGPSRKTNYRAAGSDFEAFFYFSESGLYRVALHPKDRSEADKIVQVLSSQYKAPRSDKDEWRNGCRYISRIWDDVPGNKEVAMNVTACLDEAPSMTILYSKPAAPSETGL